MANPTGFNLLKLRNTEKHGVKPRCSNFDKGLWWDSAHFPEIFHPFLGSNWGVLMQCSRPEIFLTSLKYYVYIVFPLVYLSSKYYQIIQASVFTRTLGLKLSFWKTVSLSKSPPENVIHLAYKQSHRIQCMVYLPTKYASPLNPMGIKPN